MRSKQPDQLPGVYMAPHNAPLQRDVDTARKRASERHARRLPQRGTAMRLPRHRYRRRHWRQYWCLCQVPSAASTRKGSWGRIGVVSDFLSFRAAGRDCLLTL